MGGQAGLGPGPGAAAAGSKSMYKVPRSWPYKYLKGMPFAVFRCIVVRGAQAMAQARGIFFAYIINHAYIILADPRV